MRTFENGDLLKVVIGDKWECKKGDVHIVVGKDYGDGNIATRRCSYHKGEKKWYPTGSHYMHQAYQFRPLTINKKDFEI